jgi:hypothetical protein
VNEYEAWSSTLQLDEDAFVALLTKLAGQVARTSTYPWPDGYNSWTDDAVRELVNVVYERKGKQLALKILEKANSQPALERLLLAAIKNVLIDLAKETETGKLRRRLLTVLGKDARFVHLTSPDHCWALAGCPQELWQGDREELIQAAFAVRGFHIWTWNTAGQTAGPVTEALREVSAGVLERANGAVRDQELATVLRVRFVYIAPLDASPLHDVHRDAAPTTAGSEDTEHAALLRITVDEIWSTLNSMEQAVIAYIGEDEATWARKVSQRPREAAVVVARVKEKLRLAVADDDQAEEVILELRGRSITAGFGPPELRRLLKVDPDHRRGEGDA